MNPDLPPMDDDDAPDDDLAGLAGEDDFDWAGDDADDDAIYSG
jgi:hypothetical protein